VTVTVRYPFTRWLAKSLTVIGSREQGGARHLIVCKPNNKTRCLLPEWMTFPEAGTIRIVACPRLSVAVRRRSRKQLLRTFVAYRPTSPAFPSRSRSRTIRAKVAASIRAGSASSET
jgi:hypothetical protein